MAEQRVEIPGSAPRRVENESRSSPVPPSQRIEVTVVLRRDPTVEDVGEQLLSGTFQPKSREQAASYTQAAASDLDAVK
ncbi:MAG TPA: hypothetical protein VHZ55_25255, partial [Bryobacteraceae bacterium]|nr:hypothetical protein [Bryobacteraceae bacterium]